MNNQAPVFKTWVPEWFIRITLFIVIAPAIVLFALSVANVNAAAGYYGIEPNDVQYSLIILYAAMVGFVVLEGRFIKYFAGKNYLIIGIVLQMATCYVCYTTQHLYVLLIFRFLQGMVMCGSLSIVLTLMFGRLHGERAREIGYSIVYGLLLCIIPFTTLITAAIVDAFNYNVLYKCAIFSFLPGLVFIAFIMNNVRFNRKFPLYQLDWPSFALYSFAACLLGYVLVYGQQYNWLQDLRILRSLFALVLLFLILIVRQLKLKRPYLQLSVFKYKNFKIGALMLFILYICRGSLGITSTYLATVLGLDPIHVGYLMMYNMLGIIISVLVSSRLVLSKRPMRLILIYGFVLLLIFHAYMCFLFQLNVSSELFIVPLILHGMGAGMLMVPIILFMVSSVPTKMGGTASAVALFFRFTGFCSSIALINYFQLYNQNNHYNRFQDQLSSLNPIVVQRLASYKQAVVSRGATVDRATGIANGLLNKSINVQAQLRSAMDYYQLISWILVIVILLIALFPSINKTIINVRTNQPAAGAY